MITRRGVLGMTPLAALGVRHARRMTRYLPCAGSPISLAASADATGRNPGNLTNAFTQNVLGTMPPIWEWFHTTINTQDPTQTFAGGQCNIFQDLIKPVTFTFPAPGGTDYDPAQPVQFRQGNELFFFWLLPSSTTPVPYVTLFLRYDADLPANASYLG